MSQRAFVTVAILLVGVGIVLYAAGLRRVIRSDGAGYYAFLPALIIHGELSMERGVVPEYEGEAPEWLRPSPREGYQLDKFPVGVAVMMAPFFLAAHAATRLLRLPADGFSSLYQGAAALSGVFYGIAGLWLLSRLLERRHRFGVAWTLLAILLGTNLFHYLSYDVVFSHAYSFFLFAAFVTLVEAWYEAPRWRATILLGLAAGMIALVRPTNAIAWAYLPLYGVVDGASLRARARQWLGAAPKLFAIGLLALSVCALQLLYWKGATGDWLFYSYGHECFHFDAPKPLHVLISVKKGLLLWSPVLVLALAGLIRGVRARAVDGLACALILLLQLCLVSSWWNWWYGGSFGHRAFTEHAVFFALGLGVLLDRERPRAGLRWALVSTVVVSIAAMLLYWARVIPFEGWNVSPLV